MRNERLDGHVDEQDLPAGGARLQVLDEMQRIAAEVDVCPPQAEQLALPHAGGERQDVQRLQPVALDGVEEASCLLGGERREVVSRFARRGDQFGDVAADEVPAGGVAQGVMEDPVQLQHGGLGQPRAHAVRVQLLQVPRVELGEP